MKILETEVSTPNQRPEQGCVVTIGAFDGVHLGHQALIERTIQRANEIGCASAVVTFDRHPASVIRPQNAPMLLTDLDQKLKLLAATGVDYTLVLKFDQDRAAESAEDFVKEILLERLNARHLVVGYDFHFGAGRAGNFQLLQRMGAELGFEVEEFSVVENNETVISSTEIRRLLMEGEVEQASNLLGRPYELGGLVVTGDKRGRELGYPTANINLSADILLPADGVYAGEYQFPDGSTKKTAISLGRRPTFYEDGVNLLEAYLLDFDGDLYGQQAKVKFLRHIRGQIKFDSLDALIKQIEHDVAQV